MNQVKIKTTGDEETAKLGSCSHKHWISWNSGTASNGKIVSQKPMSSMSQRRCILQLRDTQQREF